MYKLLHMPPIQHAGDESAEQQLYLQAGRLAYTEVSCKKHVTNYLVQAIPSKPLSTGNNCWIPPKVNPQVWLSGTNSRRAWQEQQRHFRNPCSAPASHLRPHHFSLMSHMWVVCSCVYAGDRKQQGQGPTAFRTSVYVSDWGVGIMKMAAFHEQL